MATLSGHHLSMADIARRAGVQRPAVNNWRRRHPDFPAAVARAGGEVFDAAEIATWLDDRKVPRNALATGEAAGITYGERFRRTFSAAGGTADGIGTRAEAPEGAGDDITATGAPGLDGRIWRLADRARGFADIGDYGDRLLELVYLRLVEADRWHHMIAALRSPTVAVTRTVADALREAGLPPYSRSEPGARRSPDSREEAVLRELAELIERELPPRDHGDEVRSTDLGPVLFRGLLDRLVAAEGHRGGEYHTPGSVVDLVAAITEPKRDERLCDPCCGAGELLVAAATRNSGRRGMPVQGLALGSRARRLAAMNLAVHGVPADVTESALDALRRPQAGDRYDVVVTNPPFNMSGWASAAESHDPRWRYGAPPPHSGNFAWLQHVAALLGDGGRAGVVMANNASFSANRAERAIRAAMVEDGLVECVIALPPGLFATTGISVTVWVLKTARPAERGVLFIDASELGRVRRAGRVLRRTEIDAIARTYGSWVRRQSGEPRDLGSAMTHHAHIEEIRAAGYDLNPRRHVRREDAFERERLTEDVHRLRTELADLQDRASALDVRMARLMEDLAPWTA